MTDTAVCNLPVYEVSVSEPISPIADKVFFEDKETLQYKYNHNTLVKVRKDITVNIIEDSLMPTCTIHRDKDMAYSFTMNIPKHVSIRLFDPTKKYQKPIASSSTVFEETEDSQMPEILNSDTSVCTLYKLNEDQTLTLVTESQKAGDYLLCFSLKDPEYEAWTDNSRDTIIIPYLIKPPTLYYTTEIPELISPMDYTGTNIAAIWKEPLPDKYIITGTTSATKAGTYTVTVSPPEGKSFEDSTETSVTRSWVIRNLVHYYSTDVPQLMSPITYTGSDINIAWQTELPENFTVTGDTVASAEGIYTVTVTAPEGYEFEDIHSNTVTRTWEIAKMKTVDQAGCLYDPDNGNFVSVDIQDRDYTGVTDYWDPGDYSEDKGYYTPVCMICECPSDLKTDYTWSLDMEVTPADLPCHFDDDITIYTKSQVSKLKSDTRIDPEDIEDAKFAWPIAVIKGWITLPGPKVDIDMMLQLIFSCRNRSTGFVTVYKTDTGKIHINSHGEG